MAKQIIWTTLKSDYFAENMRLDKQQPFTLKELSIRWKIAYKTIRNKASIEKWNDELQERIAEQQSSIIHQVQAVQIETETEIRERQATIARNMVNKAMEKLATVAPEDLTNREAIELAKLGLVEERKALGLADKYEVSKAENSEGGATVEELLQRHQMGEALMKKFLTYVDNAVPPETLCN